MSYAVYWYVGGLGARYAGRLELGASGLELSGSARGHRSLDSVPFADIGSAQLSGGRLRITRRGGAKLEIRSLDGPGSLREVWELLAFELSAGAVG